jgi:hypothetical protein
MKGCQMGTDAYAFRKTPSNDAAAPYLDEADRKKHLAYIVSIAEEKQKDIAEVAPCYERILHELRGQARVQDYLNVFVAKQVLAQLKASR